MARTQTRTGPELMWQCARCDKIHDDELSAYECCTEVYEVWVCHVCEELWDTQEQALTCFDSHADEDQPLVATASPRELEAAGQMRLVP